MRKGYVNTSGVFYVLEKFKTWRLSQSKDEKFIHYCILFQFNNSKSLNVISIGYNHVVNNKDPKGFKLIPVHAEEDAINKLPYFDQTSSNCRKINMLVVRISENNNRLYNSKPCANCIAVMNKKIIKKGFNLKDVYYSVDDSEGGDIKKQKFQNLYDEPDKHYSVYYRSLNRKIEK